MYLNVGNTHNIYYEICGNPVGIKVLFLHGGPGLGFSENDKSLFDFKKFNVIFFDQRGCGRSLPKGSLIHNTTQDTVADIERLLDHLDIDSVILFGGSWGATLAVLFAAEHPDRIDKIILRGFFSATKSSADIYLRGKVMQSHEKYWQRVISHVPKHHKSKEAEYYFEAIGPKTDKSMNLAYEWSQYGLSLSRKYISQSEIEQILSLGNIDLDKIRIELHYALNAFFIPDGYVYDQARKVANIPTIIIHGEYDYICPLEDAEKLVGMLNVSKLVVLDAGHSISEKEIKGALIKELKSL